MPDTSPTTTTKDAQTWVFPPGGAATVPVPSSGSSGFTATSNFGPVSLHDSIILEWSPATKPEIDMQCASFAQFSTYEVILKNETATPPYTFRFDDKVNQANSSDSVYCHFFFEPSSLGNTVTFQFQNEPRAEKPTTFSGGPLTTSTSSAKSSTPTSTTQNSATLTSPPRQSGSSSSLSTPTKAGIGAGVAALSMLFILTALGFYLLRRRKRKQIQSLDDNDRPLYQQIEVDPYAVHEKEATPDPVELEGSGLRHELPYADQPGELEAGNMSHELPGNPKGSERHDGDDRPDGADEPDH
ncbi:hypothetical protein NA57DRAFT_62216 [Rhizodiscina lignyota]|uniref:Uncharacterized protein n=1 Tax=Rhizodiscina lignyota TaxID=1504668 RepID=A0A9P4I3V3_9PEZI|nr:hypothetical protein NA57DRAFT_62216 [Rhizodiscina lignyota]